MATINDTQELVVERYMSALWIKLSALVTLARQEYGEIDTDTMSVCVESIAKDCVATVEEFRTSMRGFAKKEAKKGAEVAHGN